MLNRLDQTVFNFLWVQLLFNLRTYMRKQAINSFERRISISRVSPPFAHVDELGYLSVHNIRIFTPQTEPQRH